MPDLTAIHRLLDERRPGHALPRAFYNDPEIHAFDVEAIYHSNWLMVGFDCELPLPGSTLSMTIGGSPILLVRDRTGSIRGFHNSCRHRGAQLCKNGQGTAAKIVCPYHQWVYDLTGELQYAPNMPAGFEKAEHGLNPILVESIAGSLYVSLGARPADFAPYRLSLEPLLAPHGMENAKLAAEITLVEKANWKLVMENGRECYHCAANHPELGVPFPIGAAETGAFADGAFEARFAERMRAAGLPIGPADGDWWQAMRFPLNPGVVSMTQSGKPSSAKAMVPAYGGDVGSLRFAIEPHAFCHAVGDHVFFFSALPVGPELTHVVAKWYVRNDAVEGVDYDVADLVSTWDVTNRQDRDLAEMNQRGVNGIGFVPGPYSPNAEAYVIRFVDWYCRRVKDTLAERQRVGNDKSATVRRLMSA